MALIFPSLISADLLNLQNEIKTLDPYCDGYHLDIMDHHFVPNLTWGVAFMHAIAAATCRPLWVHLMVENPGTWLEELNLPAGSIVSFHIETIKDAMSLINRIHEKKWRASIALSPKTNVETIFPFLNVIDQVLVMSVEPGFSGQQFILAAVDKVDKLVAYRQAHDLPFTIGMDGGINKENITMLVDHGVQDIAIANAIFGHKDRVAALQKLKALIK
ncbi:MAG: ribulose-phosphate 3-epimerase [Candidatus Dependentiae bacterium]|nr:ribulose-phosphate 3-epimerase [Candidatus Dependentiae bacterium]